MKKILLATVLVLSAAGAYAADTCQTKAIDKNGKPLAGAALTSSINKCAKDATAACDTSAKDKNGKPLAGAAKTAYNKNASATPLAGNASRPRHYSSRAALPVRRVALL